MSYGVRRTGFTPSNHLRQLSEWSRRGHWLPCGNQWEVVLFLRTRQSMVHVNDLCTDFTSVLHYYYQSFYDQWPEGPVVPLCRVDVISKEAVRKDLSPAGVLLLYFLYVELSSWWIWWCMNLYRPLNVYLLWYFTHYVCMVRQGTWCSPGGRCYFYLVINYDTLTLPFVSILSPNSLTCPDGVQTLPTGFSRSLAVLISIDRPSQLWSVSRAETMMAFLDLFSFLHGNIECLWETRRLRGWLWISHYFGIRVLGFQCPLEETVTLWYCQN